MDQPFDLSTYYPIFIFLAILIGFCANVMVLAHTLGPRRNSAVKLMPYESGMDPIGDARQRFDIKYYLVAIMFLVFDVELLFLYPWAVVAYQDPALGGFPTVFTENHLIFWSVLAFIALLFLAFIYDWRKGVFKWR
ncbi:MAG: NADH-quinone oxidoreductase subunit A [Planctomycetota bacterium]|jgi:NADH-quinone oxidoreductase subunit A